MKKQGFTLIELLAVIVILAIIALIATPIVLNVIENSKEKAVERSAENYMDAIELMLMTDLLDEPTIANGSYKVLSDGSLCNETECVDSKCTELKCVEGKTIKVAINGEQPTGGVVSISNGFIAKTGTQIFMDNYKFVYNGEELVKKDQTDTQAKGKNLFNYVTNINLTTIDGIDVKINSDGSITVSGVITTSWRQPVLRHDITDILEDGETYTLSQGEPNEYVMAHLTTTNITTATPTPTYYNTKKKSLTFTVDKSIYKYSIAVQTTEIDHWGTEFRTITNTYQLEKGSSATSFEPYYE